MVNLESSSPASAPVRRGPGPGTILDAVRAGRSAIAPICQWDASTWPTRVAGELPDFNARELVDDTAAHKRDLARP
jgi:3-oxoacyl-(acyl-carrier-protein) synthase